MAQKFSIVRTVVQFRQYINEWREAGFSVGLVPTMGALHEGHFSLVDRSVAENDRTCVTLFVNPKQFIPNEDFDVYPRNEAADSKALKGRLVDLLYAPPLDEMYPEGYITSVSVPGIGEILEGKFRPGFFTGVATVISKLLIQSSADRAYFGEKDYQQLRVIERMAADLDIPAEIIGCPTVREKDGLALSSRNAYLSAKERATAPYLNAVLVQISRSVRGGSNCTRAVNEGKKKLLQAGFIKVDYLEVVDSKTLMPVSTPSESSRILAAVWLGKTRIIDNISF